ncbi:restriction endonuclease subunit S [Streptomyces sp. NPDC059918]|uniref:restriction endonuclease subunit S n=1 Tax=unclassified Streptomyces TaxID=2593676 RepID=UPI00365E48B7
MTNSRLPYGGSPPDSWAVVPLKYLTTLTNGYVFNSADWVDSGTPIIRIENLNGSRNFNHSGSMLPDRYRVKSGDLLFSWSGNPGTSFGPYLWSEPGDYYLNQHIFKMDVSGCDARWLYWSLKAATHWIERELTSGMIGMVHVTKEELAAVPIPVPPIELQRRIADFLDAETARMDALTSARNSQLRCLDQLWDARLARKTDELIETYGLLPLRRVASSVEQGWSPQCDDAEAGPAEWAVLKTSAVSSGLFKPLEHKRLPIDLEPDLRYQVMDGDILMTRGSGSPAHVGVAAVAETNGRKLLLSDLLYRVRLGPEWSPEYVTLLLGSRPVRGFMSLLFRGQSGQTIKLRSEDIRSIAIPAAPTTAQAALARELAKTRLSIREAQAAIRSSSAVLAERRQALITAAVTGQFDVSTASGRNVTDGVTA